MFLTDCQVTINNTVIHASKFVLSINSKYFESIFTHNNMKCATLSFGEEDEDLKCIIEWVHLPQGINYNPPGDKIISLLLLAQKYLFDNIAILLRKIVLEDDSILSIDDPIIIDDIFCVFNEEELNCFIHRIVDEVDTLPLELNSCLINYLIQYSNKSGYIPQHLIRLLNRISNDCLSKCDKVIAKESLRTEFEEHTPIYSDNIISIDNDGNYIIRMEDLKTINFHYPINSLQPLNCKKLHRKLGHKHHDIEVIGNKDPKISDWNGNNQECLLIDDYLDCIPDDYGQKIEEILNNRKKRIIV